MSDHIPELIRKSALEIRQLLRSSEVSITELLDALQNRIAQVDSDINALPTLCFDRARNQADSVNPDTILGGIPVAIKDLSEVSGVRTTFGSRVYENHIPRVSCLLVRHLEKNGAVIYAKSNTPEFGTGGNTINFVHGATCNPWNTELSVAGSSGGAAAALASGTAWLAQGSDMGGSLRNPASFCNIVGMRPSIGRVASSPDNIIQDTLATNGPMARNVTDLALFLDAMCGHEPECPLSLPSPTTPFLESALNPVRPGKIAFSMDLGMTPVDAEVRSVIQRAVDNLANHGYRIEQAHPDFSGLHDVFHTLRAHDYAVGLGDLLDRNEHLLNPNVVWNIRQGMELTRDDLIRAESGRVEIVNRCQAFFTEYDCLLTPATIVPPYPLSQDYVSECDGHRFENYYQWLSIAYAFTTALCPALSLPCGFSRTNLPVGLQIASASQNDARVISIAAGMEKTFDLGTTRPINPRPDTG